LGSQAVVVLVLGVHGEGARLRARNADSAGLGDAGVLVPAWNEHPAAGVPQPMRIDRRRRCAGRSKPAGIADLGRGHEYGTRMLDRGT